MEKFVKRLQLVRKKLLPLLLCVAVAGSQVPVMAADVGGFSDSAEGFNEEWSEDTQAQSAGEEDTTETAEGNTTENNGSLDEQTEDIAEAADGDTEDIALQSSGEDTEAPEISEGSSSDSQDRILLICTADHFKRKLTSKSESSADTPSICAPKAWILFLSSPQAWITAFPVA